MLINQHQNADQSETKPVQRYQRVPLIALVLGSVTLVVAICFFATMRYYTGGHVAAPVDSTYITLHYAQETASGHFFAFSKQGGAGSGMPSSLTVLALALFWLLGAHGQALLVIAFGLESLLLFASAWLVFLLVLAFCRSAEQASSTSVEATPVRTAGGYSRFTHSWPADPGSLAALLAALLVLTNGATLWGYFSDSSLALFGSLLLATLFAFVQAQQHQRYLLLGICAALLVLSHPLGMIFALLPIGLHYLLAIRKKGMQELPSRSKEALGISSPHSSASRAIKQLAASVKDNLPLLLPLVVALAWTGYLFATGSSLFPSVLRANWPFSAVPLYWPETLNDISNKAIILWKQVYAGYYFDSSTPPFFAPFFIFFFLLGLLPAGWQLWLKPTELATYPVAAATRGALLTLLWFLAGTLIVPVLGEQPYHSAAIPFFPLFLLIGTRGLERFAALWEVGANSGSRRVLAGLGSFFLLFGLLSTVQFTLTYGKNSQSIYDRQATLGLWVQAHLPPGARVAVTDPGAIAYLGEHPVLDLTGTTDAAVIGPARNGQGSLARYLIALPLAKRPTYFIGYPDYYYSYWSAGLYGPELHRVHLFQNYMGGGDMVVSSLDWSQAGTGDYPAGSAALQAISGKVLVDALRVADLADEAGHHYRFWPFEPGLVPWSITRKLPEADAPGTILLDSGRGLSGGEEFTIASRPGHDLTLILRTASPHPVELRVWVNGRATTPLHYAQGKNAWVETVYTIPAALLQGSHTSLRLERVSENQTTDEHISYHYWAYQ